MSRFGAGLEVRRAELVGRARRPVAADAAAPADAVRRRRRFGRRRPQVALGAAHQHRQRLRVAAIAHRLHPVSRVEQRRFVGDVEEHEDAVGLAEVGLGDGSETLLAGRVPQLDGHHALVHAQRLHFKVHT